MNKFIVILAALLTAAPLRGQEFSTAAMRPITLGEAYNLSLTRSETLALQGEHITRLTAAERRIASAFRPGLDLNAIQSRQQNAPSSTKGFVTGSYELFSGMRDYIGVKAAGAKTEAAQLSLIRARQELYLSVARSYINLLEAQREIDIRIEQLGVTSKRIDELRARAEIGRTRKSEVVAAQTQLAQDKASYLDAAATERLAQQALMFLTGLDTDMAPTLMIVRPDAPLEDYLKLCLLRPDLASARKNLEVYGYLADMQDRVSWPSITLSADYYLVRKPMPAPVNRWDAGAAFNLPLYTGGYARAAKDSAYSEKRAANLSLRLAERQALSDVRSAYEDYRYTRLRKGSLEEALSLASENARYQAEDYKLGLVTNLDVLSALNSMLQTRLALSQARALEHLNLLKLETSAGMEPK